MIYVDDGSHGGHGLDVFGVGVALLILMEPTHHCALDGFVDAPRLDVGAPYDLGDDWTLVPL